LIIILNIVGRSLVSGASIEPISLLNSIPGLPTILKVSPFSSDRIEKLAESFGSTEKVLEVIKEFTELPSPQYIPLPKATLAQTLQYTIPTAEATTMEDSGTHTEAPTESLVVCVSYIAQCQWNEDSNAPSWLTYYSDGSRSWEPRSSFVDSDGTQTDIFKDWCSQNRVPSGPPKKRKRKQSESENEKEVTYSSNKRGRGMGRGRGRGIGRGLERRGKSGKHKKSE